jgi:hypothetical protein
MTPEKTFPVRPAGRPRRGAWCAALGAGLIVLAARGMAQTPVQAPAAASQPDPRVGLKPGLDDAGVAAKNLELVAHLPKPEGFNDPNGSLNFANSDLAFQRDHLFLGNFNGLNFYTIEDPKQPSLTTSVVCPGGQGDVSIYGHLLFMSVEQTRGRLDCGTEGVEAPVSAERFRGIRIFDISNLKSPTQIAAVQTCRGSHTHTLVPDPKDPANLYVYGSGTSSVRSGEELAGCSEGDPKDDPNTALFSIDVIQVPLAAPETAHIVNRPRIFADAAGNIAGLWAGGDHGEGTQSSRTTNQCHDITVYPAVGLAAGACSGNGILLDIADPAHPVRIDAVTDPSFAYWHSATFNNDGTKVIFTDEWGGGTQPRCRATDRPNWGADAIFDIVDRKLQFRGYFKMPAAQTEVENCVAHNGSLIPVPGRDIMAQAWYQGGVSVFDFTDSAHPFEIAYFDRGPINPEKLTTAGYWSTYWYNGYLYGSEIGRGLDIFRFTPGDQISQNEIEAAALVRVDEVNVQDQQTIAWPASFVVARAYLDQLARSRGIQAGRASAVTRAMDQAERQPAGTARTAALDELETLAAALDQDAAAATGRDAARLRALSSTIKARTAALRTAD